MAARLGADAVGLVFYPPSPRAVTIEQARAVIGALPPFVTTVALFLNPDRGEVERVLEALPVDLLQFHGDEPAAFCAGFGRPYVKALAMGAELDFDAAAKDHAGAAALLLDGHAHGEAGGQGRPFGWRRLESPLPLVLAGGLGPDNVAAAIAAARPFAVDVASGVESAPGIKDHERMAAFVAEVNRAGQS